MLVFGFLVSISVVPFIRGQSTCSAGVCAAPESHAGFVTSVPKGANPEGKPNTVNSTECSDRHKQCVGFAEHGECSKNPGWMIINCAKSCGSCQLRDPKLRCSRKALNISDVPTYVPGDMNRIFSSLESEFESVYNVTVVSRSPWVMTFENFITQAEADAIIKSVSKWERSTDTGQANEFGEVGRVLSSGRTSSNAWCRESCEADPLVQNVVRKIEQITKVPSGNYESFQILRYEVGQYYRPHSDYGISQKSLACGPRILTFFLYLSDVEEGGETAFPNIGIKVRPKFGQAVLWPSTLDESPEDLDIRTQHSAEPVKKGIKYAANAWIHMYDFKIPNLWGCTGTFDELSD